MRHDQDRTPISLLRAVAAAVLLVAGAVELLRFLAALGAPGSAYLLALHAIVALLSGSAGIGLWLGLRWAPAAILALGGFVAASRLVDAFVLGIRPWLFALVAALAALVFAVLLAAWAKRHAGPLARPGVR